jgi:ferrous iron transport protein A
MTEYLDTAGEREGLSMALTQLKSGQTATVASIQGGYGMVRRLNALGIYEGKSVTKISGQWMHGPVIVRIGSTDVAIGYGMARRIFVTFATLAVT